MADLEPGLYDQLIDEFLRPRLEGLAAERLRADLQAIEPAELPNRIGEVLGRWVSDALASVTADDRADAAVHLSQAVLSAINAVQPDAVGAERMLAAPLARLAAVERLAPTDEPLRIRRPLTPLRDTVLMTNATGQPTVGAEIEAEIDSADRIDLVLAFIRWTGIRHLLPHLRRHAEAGKPLRIITTTYTGSTELRALQALTDLGAQVKVSYDTSTIRLHAKAWMFHRSSGFSTVYIGSSNLTFSAQVTGLEWNVRASQRLNPDLVAAFDRTFATYDIARLLHLDDQERIDTYGRLLSQPQPPAAADLDERTRRQLEGLLLTVLNPRKDTYASLDEAATGLWRHDGLRQELLEVLPILEDRIIHLHRPLGLLHPVPLQVHANYTREEILAAFGASTVTKPLPLQTGVYWHEPTRTDLLFITLQKSDKDYSPTTRYLDYAISEHLFHWESQAKDTVASDRGQNYIHHEIRGRTVALFIRSAKKDQSGRTVPYFCARHRHLRRPPVRAPHPDHLAPPKPPARRHLHHLPRRHRLSRQPAAGLPAAAIADIL